MKTRVLFLLLTLILLSTHNTFAGWDKKPQLRWTELYHFDVRHNDEHELVTSRFNATFDYLGQKDNSCFKISPFFEARRNTQRNLWERIEVGAEIGKDIFPWLYLGDGLQAAWLKEDYRDYRPAQRRVVMETEGRFLLSKELSYKKLTYKPFLLDEYTYDLDIGAGVRNEVAIGVSVPVGKHFETCLNWRHIDRIHDFDSDTFELSGTVIF